MCSVLWKGTGSGFPYPETAVNSVYTYNVILSIVKQGKIFAVFYLAKTENGSANGGYIHVYNICMFFLIHILTYMEKRIAFVHALVNKDLAKWS